MALSRIRARGAENLHRSWLNVPHVTQHDEADVTDLEAFRGELKAEAQANGAKLTPLAFIVKAVVATLQTFPTFNASLDPEVRNLIVKRYYHIGLAVDTPEGLIVPVLRDADQKGVFDLAKEIEALSQKALEGKLAVTDLQGASFTISSLGSIGGTGFTPIINAPEVAILGVSRLAMKPHWNGATFEPRRMLPLSLELRSPRDQWRRGWPLRDAVVSNAVGHAPNSVVVTYSADCCCQSSSGVLTLSRRAKTNSASLNRFKYTASDSS